MNAGEVCRLGPCHVDLWLVTEVGVPGIAPRRDPHAGPNAGTVVIGHAVKHADAVGPGTIGSSRRGPTGRVTAVVHAHHSTGPRPRQKRGLQKYGCGQR